MVLKSFFISTLSPLRCFRILIFWKSSQDDMWSSKSLCSLWSKYLSPLNSYVENLMPDMMILGSGAFRRWLGHECEALMNGMNAIIKWRWRAPCRFPPREDTVRRRWLWTRKRTLTCYALISDFPTSRTARDKCLLFISPPGCGILLHSPNRLRHQSSPKTKLIDERFSPQRSEQLLNFCFSARSALGRK